MGHDYNKAKKLVFRGMWLLAAVTLVEVAVSLFGKGHLGINPEGIGFEMFGTFVNPILILVGLALIVLSIYKAYFIIYEFMHMGHEVRGLRMSVLLPVLLLVWAVIAFFQEGNSWEERRSQINDFNQIKVEDVRQAPPSNNGGTK